MRSNKRRGIPSLLLEGSLVLGGTVHVMLLSTVDVLLEPAKWKRSSYQACEVGAAAGGPPVLAKGSCRMKQPRCVERQPSPPACWRVPPVGDVVCSFCQLCSDQSCLIRPSDGWKRARPIATAPCQPAGASAEISFQEGTCWALSCAEMQEVCLHLRKAPRIM